MHFFIFIFIAILVETFPQNIQWWLLALAYDLKGPFFFHNTQIQSREISVRAKLQGSKVKRIIRLYLPCTNAYTVVL